MKRFALSIILATVLAGVPLAFSMTVGSDFGFEIKLPANWTALSENCHKASRAQEKGTRGVPEARSRRKG